MVLQVDREGSILNWDIGWVTLNLCKCLSCIGKLTYEESMKLHGRGVPLNCDRRVGYIGPIPDGPFLRAPVICGCGAKNDSAPEHVAHLDCQCNGKARADRQFRAPFNPAFTFALYRDLILKDVDGFTLCKWCYKIVNGNPNSGWLTQRLIKCPKCKKRFKGPARRIKTDYECKECR